MAADPKLQEKPEAKKKGEVDANEVGAVEDLMREQGILRRCFLAYRECAGRLRIDPSRIDDAALNDAARLFRTFGEDYHEKKLEEVFIFPKVKLVLPGKASSVDTLIAQHDRGREITNYVLAMTRGARVSASDAETLARAFEAFEIVYANRTARDDTRVFPAWKNALSAKDLAEMGDRFEDKERETFFETVTTTPYTGSGISRTCWASPISRNSLRQRCPAVPDAQWVVWVPSRWRYSCWRVARNPSIPNALIACCHDTNSSTLSA